MTESMAKAISNGAPPRNPVDYNEKFVVPTARQEGQQLDPEFLELSRKLKQDGPDADLVGQWARRLGVGGGPDAGLAPRSRS